MPQDINADRIALQDLMLTYAAAIDERDRERYAACFADDVEVVGFGSGPIQGRAAWLDYVFSALGNYRTTQHLLAPSMISLEGNSASVRTDVQATHVLTESETDQRLILRATYHSRARRTGDGWQIYRHELVVRDLQAS